MKIKSLAIAAILSAAGMVGMMLAHAQETVTSIQPAPADDIVQLTADEAGLTPMSSAGLPRGATYWVILPGYIGKVNPLPYPCLPVTLTNSPIYDITGNIFLVDATGGQVLTGGNLSGTRASSSTIASVLALQANTVENLILMVQGAAALSTSTTMSANAEPMGGGIQMYDLSGGVPYLTIASTGTNQVTVSIANGITNAFYEIYSVEFLTDTNWLLAAEGTLGQTNFIFSTSQTDTGFFRAVNGNDFDGDGIPNYEDARPNDASIGLMTVTIEKPANGSNVQ